jgi:hypothetical protein
MSWTKWAKSGGRLDEPSEEAQSHPWYAVIWLTGVDYFSTLGYQPGIALLAAGALSPIATAILVAVTLLCAFPVYAQVSARSYVGQGSIAMLENLVPGWAGKIFVLALLGFAATDFVITMTLSAADATQHLIENPVVHSFLAEDWKIPLTIALLAVLAYVFIRGFKEAIELATFVCVPYLALNVVVLARAVLEVMSHPQALGSWKDALHARGDWTAILVASIFLFPRLALGLSGFETGVSVMPLIHGGPLGRGPAAAEDTEYPEATPHRGADHERSADAFELRDRSAHPARGVQNRRTRFRARHRLSRAQSAGQHIWHGVRHFHHPDPLVCRSVGHGGTLAPDSAISSAFRTRARLVGLFATARSRAVYCQCRSYARFPR